MRRVFSIATVLVFAVCLAVSLPAQDKKKDAEFDAVQSRLAALEHPRRIDPQQANRPRLRVPQPQAEWGL
jgi:hypothetical protein